jgi:hypothetical protein
MSLQRLVTNLEFDAIQKLSVVVMVTENHGLEPGIVCVAMIVDVTFIELFTSETQFFQPLNRFLVVSLKYSHHHFTDFVDSAVLRGVEYLHPQKAICQWIGSVHLNYH